MLRIKQAIDFFNFNRPEGSERMTQESLAEKVLPDKNSKTAGIYMSAWCTGKRLGAFKPKHVVAICEATGVDANYLFNVEPMNNIKNA